MGTDFEEMLKTAFEIMGGLKKLINNNQDVLIKPNFNAVDVYPAISSAGSIATLAKQVVTATTGKVRVGDVGFHAPTQVYQHVNLEAALANTGAEAIYFSNTYNVRRDTWDPSKPDYLVYSEVYDAPIIINFACIKRHFLARMSTALKNNVGTIAGSGGTQSRGYLHNLSGTRFLQEIAEIAGLINPELTIVDARSILIGNGPFSTMPGAQILRGVNWLIMSGDMVAVDVYCSMFLQSLDGTFSASQIAATLERADALGLGVKDLNEVEIIETVASVDESNNPAPLQFELYQNYPNPFNVYTKIGFKIEEKNFVTLNVYNSLGRKISTLVNKEMAPGDYSINFDGKQLPSGTYFYQLRVGHQVLTKSMTLLR